MNRFIALLSPLAFLLLFTALPAQSPDSIQSRQGPRWIGVTTGPASAALRAQLALPRNQGIVVRSITPDSPAAKSGLRTNDLLLSVDETILSKPRDLSRLVGQTDRPKKPLNFYVEAVRKKYLSIRYRVAMYLHKQQIMVPRRSNAFSAISLVRLLRLLRLRVGHPML